MSGNYSIRQLDPAERFIWLLDRISCANFMVMAELTERSLSAEVVRRGLDMLQRSHPLLSARVIEAPTGQVEFFREEGSRIPLQVEERGEDDWTAPIEAEFSATFDDPGLPLARCHLLRLPGRSVLSITFHHVIADARSGVSLLKELLRFCLRGIETLPSQMAPPPMHSMFPREFQWWDHRDEADALAQRINEEFLGNGAPSDLPFLAHREPGREPRLRTIRLDADQGRRLRERCRTEGASVHGAICAAHLLATHRMFDEEQAKMLYFMCPVDMRAHLTSDMSGHLSYCSTFLRSNYRVESGTDFWSLARDIGADLKRRLQRGDGHLAYASLPLNQINSVGLGFDAFASSLEQLPAGSNISNIGSILPLDDCPEVESISFALCGMSKHLASLNVSSYNDQLIVNLTFDAAKLAPELMDRLVDSLSDSLNRAATVVEATSIN